MCGKDYDARQALLAHRRRCGAVKRHSCTDCGKGFARISELLAHIRAHSGAKPFEWGECGQRFSRKGHLSVNVHSFYEATENHREERRWNTNRAHPTGYSEESEQNRRTRSPTPSRTCFFSDAGPGNPAYWCQLLIVAGDIHPNPGPPRWPCGSCGKNVSANDTAHDCDQCKTWFHLRCSPLEQLPHEGQEWRCDACTGGNEHRTFTDLMPLLLTRFNFELPPEYLQEVDVQNQRLDSGAGNSGDATAVLPGVGTLQRPDGHQRSNQQAGSGGGPQDTEGGLSRAPCRKNSLRLLQWNAGGLKSKQPELLKFLVDRRIDVALLQETHLKPTQNMRFPGYNTVRKDRDTGRAAGGETRGGGVLTLIREGLEYEVVNANLNANDQTTDALHTVIHVSRKERIDVLNVYVPPIRQGEADGRQQNFDPRHWPSSFNTLICGDINGHSPQWDDSCDEEDAIGQLIADWMLDWSFMPANTGEATRYAHDGHGTAPDVTLHRTADARKVHWRVGDDLGSDHMPIIIDYRVSRSALPAQRRTFWNTRKADWNAYRRLIDDRLRTWTCRDEQLAAKNVEFVKAVISSAEASIPRGSRKDYKPFWTAELDAAVRERNRARRHAPEQYTAAAQRVRTLMAEAKRKHWEDFASSLNAHTDDNKTWRVLKALDGRAGQPRSGAAIRRNGRTVTTPKGKANAFATEYAAVSRMHHDVEDRRFHNSIMDQMRIGCHCHHCQDFTMAELSAALKELQPRKAPGEDGVTNDMLRQLSESGRNALLSLANASWRSKRCPGKWTSALIVPIPKAGKDASDLQSYRPISLTSCVAKTVERTVKNRMADWLERNNKLTGAQSGFRKMRSTEDQLLYLTQSIKDGFNQKPARRTLLTLVDFSRAFDRVWRTGLYSKMIAMGMPTCIVQWVHGFLSDRRARVRIDDCNSRSFPLKAGTPQGSVLSPLLFLIFVNDILDDMPAGVEASLYADDLALWAQGVDLADIKARMQTALDQLATWAECWKMQINVEKTVTTFFTTEASQSRWRPELLANGQLLPYDAAPTFLGVTLDWALRFTAHAKKVRSKMTKRLNFLSALRGTKWGCSRRIMRNLYNAYVRSVADYGGAARMPAANKTALDQVDAANRRAARIITGCLRSSPTELLLEEADLMPTEHRRDQLCSIAYEKALRLPEDNPRHRCATRVQRQRLQTQSSFREHAKVLGRGELLGELPREPLRPVPLVPLWKQMPNVTLSADLLRTTRRADDPILKRLTAEDTLRQLPPAGIEIWTDGAAQNGHTNGGYGFVALADAEVLYESNGPAGGLCSSFRAELLALRAALQWLEQARRPADEVRICTDSRSTVQALQSGPRSTTDGVVTEIWQLIERMFPADGAHLTIQWIPGHCGLDGNEAADRLAGGASNIIGQQQVPVDYSSAKAAVKRRTKERWKQSIAHNYYGHKRQANRTAKQEFSVAEERILSQLRCNGHCPLLQTYKARIGADASATCPNCRMEDETAEHCLLRCPATEQVRIQLLGHNPTLSILWEDPQKVIGFLRSTGRIGGHRLRL